MPGMLSHVKAPETQVKSKYDSLIMNYLVQIKSSSSLNWADKQSPFKVNIYICSSRHFEWVASERKQSPPLLDDEEAEAGPVPAVCSVWKKCQTGVYVCVCECLSAFYMQQEIRNSFASLAKPFNNTLFLWALHEIFIHIFILLIDMKNVKWEVSKTFFLWTQVYIYLLKLGSHLQGLFMEKSTTDMALFALLLSGN